MEKRGLEPMHPASPLFLYTSQWRQCNACGRSGPCYRSRFPLIGLRDICNQCFCFIKVPSKATHPVYYMGISLAYKIVGLHWTYLFGETDTDVNKVIRGTVWLASVHM